MSATLEMINRGPITYESAAQKDANIINQQAYVAATRELYQELWEQRHTISALVKHHLKLSDQDTCDVATRHQWIRGSFNVCIPIEVKSASSCRKVVLRCPMPYKLAETKYPGTVNEKLGCEVGTYVWMQDRCPNVRIPHLYGFGFSDHRHFTHEAQRPIYIRVARIFQRLLHDLLQYPTLSCYTANPTGHRLTTAYMLLEYIDSDTGQMLSNTWDKQRGDPARRRRLFHGMAGLILSLARIPQPRIGSFQFHNDCTITLTNRPLTCSTIVLENDGAPRTMQRNDTHMCTESFVADMLTFYDNRFLSDPNAVFDDKDCRGQMAVRTLLRALSHHYIKRECRNGPFLLQLTDLHASNIFVDKEWNVSCLIDLEWVCALPREMLAVPYWLTGRGIDQIEGEHLREFEKVWQEFMEVFEEEERKIAAKHDLAQVMLEMWESKGTWFWHCIGSMDAMYYLVLDHICPRFSARLGPKTEQILSKFWREDSGRVVERKVADQQRYDEELRRLFDIQADRVTQNIKKLNGFARNEVEVVVA